VELLSDAKAVALRTTEGTPAYLQGREVIVQVNHSPPRSQIGLGIIPLALGGATSAEDLEVPRVDCCRA
jgi:hypothetical protein